MTDALRENEICGAELTAEHDLCSLPKGHDGAHQLEVVIPRRDALREKFEQWARVSGIAFHFAWEQGRGYLDSDTWKAFAAWQAAQPTAEQIAWAANKIAVRSWDDEDAARVEIEQILRDEFGGGR